MQIDMKQPILDKNDQLASELRARFAENRVFVLDLLASPGSGKTSTILATIDALRDEFNIAVIEGDIASNVDAERITAQGIPAVQINTGENAKVMILSVPEGDDKPLKYPGVFQVAEAVVLNKVDTLPVFNFDREAFESAVCQLNPQAPIFPIAATKGDGVEAWAEWLADRIREIQ